VGITGRHVLYEEGGGNRGFNIYLEGDQLYVGGWNKDVTQSDWDGSFLNTTFVPGEWNHVALVLDNASDVVEPDKFKGYFNGSLFGSGDGAQVYAHVGNITIGASDAALAYHDGSFAVPNDYDGEIDELAVYNRVLSDTEILERYKRGVLNVRFQIRSCPTLDCLGVLWTGPDGTETTYFSEDGNTADSPPQFDITVSDARYFQYMAFLTTEDGAISPAIVSLTLGPDHYNGSSPSIVNTIGAPFVSFITETSFEEQVSPDTTGTVTYQLSPDGTTWYYHNGLLWVEATGAAQSNLAIQVSVVVREFPAVVGEGAFFFKAFLNSDGTQVVELDTVRLNKFFDIPFNGVLP